MNMGNSYSNNCMKVFSPKYIYISGRKIVLTIFVKKVFHGKNTYISYIVVG